MKEIGQILKQARLQQGLSLEQVSKDTRIKLPTLDIIESGEIDRYHDDLFYHRLFIYNYADYLGVDKEMIREMYDKAKEQYDHTVEISNEEELNRRNEEMVARMANINKGTMSRTNTIFPEHSRRRYKKNVFEKYRGVIYFMIVFVLLVLIVFGIWTILKQVSSNDTIDTKPSNAVVSGEVKPSSVEENMTTQVINNITITKDKVDETLYIISGIKKEDVVITFSIPKANRSWIKVYGNDANNQPVTFYEDTLSGGKDIVLEDITTDEVKLRFGYPPGTVVKVNDQKIPVNFDGMTDPYTLKLQIEK